MVHNVRGLEGGGGIKCGDTSLRCTSRSDANRDDLDAPTPLLPALFESWRLSRLFEVPDAAAALRRDLWGS